MLEAGSTSGNSVRCYKEIFQLLNSMGLNFSCLLELHYPKILKDTAENIQAMQ